jgi:hypothetical protein
MWFALAGAAVIVGVGALMLRRLLGGSSSEIDAGNVSESWLGEQRGKKN